MAKTISVKDLELPVVRRNVTLFAPGVHNGLIYTPESIASAYKNTAWNHYSQSLYLDHRDNFALNPVTGQKDKQVDAEVRYYAGYVDNLRLTDGGVIKGDVYITDLETALKLELGAKFAISPAGRAYTTNGKKVNNMVIHNWAIVVNPAQKVTFLNSESQDPVMELEEGNYYAFAMSEEVKMDDEKKEDIKEEEVEQDESSSKIKELEDEIARLKEVIDGMAKKKKKEEYPEPAEGQEDKEEEKKDEEAEKKKKEKYPEYPEASEELDDEVLGLIREMSDEELSEWKKLVKKYGIKEAAKIYKQKMKEAKMEEVMSEIKEVKENIEKLSEATRKMEDLGEPDMISVQSDDKSIEQLSDREVDELMLKYVERLVRY